MRAPPFGDRARNRARTDNAHDDAFRRRCPEAGLLHHSDQGSPYASEDYRDLLAANGIKCSMSRRGNCYDNAVAESWFSTLKAAYDLLLLLQFRAVRTREAGVH